MKEDVIYVGEPANNLYFKTQIQENAAEQMRAKELYAFYQELSAYECQYQFCNSKQQLKKLHESILLLIDKHQNNIHYRAPCFSVSTKSLTIFTRSIFLYTTLCGLLLMLTSPILAITAPIIVIAPYVLYKAYEDISKEERGLRIQEIILTAKSAVLNELKVPNILPLKTTPQKSGKLFQSIFNSSTRNAFVMFGTMFSIYAAFFGLGIMMANPLVLTIAITTSLVGAIIYGLVDRHHKKQLSKRTHTVLFLKHQVDKRHILLKNPSSTKNIKR